MMLSSFPVPDGASADGWTAYTPLSTDPPHGQTFFSLTVRFALLEPCGVWVGGYGARGEHLRIMAGCRLVRSVLCGYFDAPRVCDVVG